MITSMLSRFMGGRRRTGATARRGGGNAEMARGAKSLFGGLMRRRRGGI